MVRKTLGSGRTGGRWIATSHLGVSDESVEAGALGAMTDTLAFGVGTAGGRRVAHVDALVVEARMSRRAVRIRPAANFAHAHRADLSARAVRVLAADGHTHTLTAAALVDQALRVGRAERPAHRALTRESGSAALGACTRSRFAHARHIGRRISEEAGWTGALSSLADNVAESVGAADGRAAAWILAAAVDAGLVR